MTRLTIALATPLLVLLTACGEGAHDAHDADGHSHDGTEHSHDETPGQTESGDHEEGEEGHAHDETSLGSAQLGDFSVELAQGHGPVVAGQEGHLVVKLPYNDAGATTVRAWIGTDDRTLSYVGLGEYAPDHDDYDVHAVAPSPLPAAPRWWIEIERPDGQTLVGSATPILE